MVLLAEVLLYLTAVEKQVAGSKGFQDFSVIQQLPIMSTILLHVELVLYVTEKKHPGLRFDFLPCGINGKAQLT